MARWLALGITLVCFGSCSFTSTSVYRGMLAPLGVIVFGLVTLALFIHDRVASAARPSVAATMDPEVQMLMRKRAAERKAEQERLQAQQSPAGARRAEPST